MRKEKRDQENQNDKNQYLSSAKFQMQSKIFLNKKQETKFGNKEM